MKAMVTKDNWIICGKCGHKLAKVVGAGHCDPAPILQFKCHSCKEINIWAYDYWRKSDDE